jgi:hypothetical protein
MSFFKKIGKSVSSAFKKAPSVVSNLFKKGEGLASKIAGGLDQVGSVLGKVGDIGGQILSNPLLEAGASAIFGPEAGVGMGLAGQALGQIKNAQKLSGGVSNVLRSGIGASQTARSGDLRGGFEQARGTIEKAKSLRDDAGVAGPMFM